ncbi:MAG: magnesium/cobalt transporter CorA [Candidatus Woesearchaeota archaeon]|nr:magnesium/cobalt transporter CorA [Candidatus Woesearchaeota archaeon]
MLDIFYYENKEVKKANSLSEVKGKLAWVDVTNLNEKEARELAEAFELHPLTIEDMTKWDTRIKIEEFPDYLYCVFYSIKDTKKSFLLRELDYVIGKNIIISSHQESALWEPLKKDYEKMKYLFEKGTDFFFHYLMDHEIDNFFPVIDILNEQIEDIEENIVKKPQTKDLSRILHLKKEFRRIKRIGFQQREKISFLAKNDYKYISHKSRPYFRDLYDHAIRVSDAIDNHRDAISEAFDAYMSAVNNSMNEVMKMLSVFATIALPMTVISGIFGTNFEFLPFAHLRYGFWTMVGMMFIFSTGMLYMFRKKGWI